MKEDQEHNCGLKDCSIILPMPYFLTGEEYFSDADCTIPIVVNSNEYLVAKKVYDNSKYDLENALQIPYSPDCSADCDCVYILGRSQPLTTSTKKDYSTKLNIPGVDIWVKVKYWDTYKVIPGICIPKLK